MSLYPAAVIYPLKLQFSQLLHFGFPDAELVYWVAYLSVNRHSILLHLMINRFFLVYMIKWISPFSASVINGIVYVAYIVTTPLRR